MIAKHLTGIVGLAFLAGCAGPKQTEQDSSRSTPEDMQRYEREFRPSEYDKEVSVIFSELRTKNTQPTEPVAVGLPVAVQGFRVQILATPEIDGANATKADAEKAFPGEWFYIVFDPPTYKVRVGNFLTRTDAEAYVRVFSENGFPDAWIVPDRVVKNIHPRQAEQPHDQRPPD